MADKKISQLTAATTPLDGTEVLPIVQSGTTVKVQNNDLRPKQIQSNATSGVLQVAGPAAAATRVMTTPDANFTAARTDAAQTFTGDQTFNDRLGVGESPNASFNLWVKSARPNFINNTNATGDGLVLRAGSTSGQQALDVQTYDGGNYLLRVRGDGQVTVQLGNLVVGTAAKGVNFNANTPAAGMTSQLLNWYEEGTWTPTIRGSGTAGTYEIGTNGCTYTRIGRQVTLNVYIQMAGTVTGGGSGDLQITGVPYAKAANANPVAAVYLALGTFTGDAPTASWNSFSSSSTLVLNQIASGGYGTAIPISYASANAYITFTMIYFV